MASFYWDGWRVDLSLNFFILAAVATGFALMTAVQAVNALIGLPARARDWRLLRLERAAQAALREALAEYFGGRYGRAHKAAQRAIAIQDDRQDAGDDHEFRTAGASAGRGQPAPPAGPHPPRRAAAPGTAPRPPWRQPGGGRRRPAAGRRMGAGRPRRPACRGPAGRVAARRGPPHPGTAAEAAGCAAGAPADGRTAHRALAGQPPGVFQHGRTGPAALAGDRGAGVGPRHRPAAPLPGRRSTQPTSATPSWRRALRAAPRNCRRAEDGRAWLRPLWDRLDTLGADGRAEVALALVDTVVPAWAPDWLARVETAQRAHPTEPAVQAAVGAVLAERQLWGKARRPLEMAAQRPACCRHAPAARPGARWPGWRPKRATMPAPWTACARPPRRIDSARPADFLQMFCVRCSQTQEFAVYSEASRL